MANDVTMPKLSDTMEEGKILRWLKKPGDRVSRGEVLAEVETDKADMELEAEAEGVLSELVVPEGGSAAVGQVIARLGEGAAERQPSGDGARPAEETEDEEKPALADARAKPDEDAEQEEEEEEEERPRPRAVPPRPDRAARSERGDHRREAAPALVPPRPAPRAERPASAKKPAAAGREELSKIRRTVAHRMAESKRQAPHFYLTIEIDMGECVRLKDSLAKARPDEPVSYTHLLVRAVALALAEHPRINARYVPEDAIEYSSGIHVGVAVALEEGLIVPVLHDCESKDVFTIAAEGRALVDRVRSGKAEGKDLSGGTFTISNLGMFPIDEFAAVINPPQAAVLAVGALGERPVVKNGRVEAATTMRMTLSSDHRVIDGAEGARFLASLKAILENPVQLVL